MKDFKLNEQGDVVFCDGAIHLTADESLLSQKIRQILSTNRGEWWLDAKEGIPVQEVLKKNPDKRLIRDYIRRAVRQADASLELKACEFETKGRNLFISFTAGNERQTVTVETEV